MPNVKKQAVEAVKKKLEREQENIRWKTTANKHEIKTLAGKQARLKRELAVIQDLIRGLEPKGQKGD